MFQQKALSGTVFLLFSLLVPLSNVLDKDERQWKNNKKYEEALTRKEN